jgi:CHAT domain-containing protein
MKKVTVGILFFLNLILLGVVKGQTIEEGTRHELLFRKAMDYFKASNLDSAKFVISLIQREISIDSNDVKFQDAQVLNNIGLLWREMGSLLKAEESFEQSLKAVQKLGKMNSHEFTVTLNNLASLLSEMKNYEGAYKYYRSSLDIRLQLYPDTSHFVCKSLENIAYLNLNFKKIDSAKYYFDLLKIKKYKSCNYSIICYKEYLYNLNDFYEKIDCSEVWILENFREILKLYNEDIMTDSSGYFKVKHDFAQYLLKIEDYKEAIDNFYECAKFYRNKTPQKLNQYILILNDLGVSHLGKGDLEKSLSYFEEAKLKCLEHKLDSSYTYCLILSNQAVIFHRQRFMAGFYDTSKELIDIIKGIEIPDSRFISLLETVGKKYTSLGLFGTARVFLDLSGRFIERIDSIEEKELYLSKHYWHLGDLNQGEMNYEDALTYFKLGLELSKKHSFKEQILANGYAVAAVQNKQNKIKDALESIKILLKIDKNYINHDGINLLLGDIFIKQGKYDFALSCYIKGQNKYFELNNEFNAHRLETVILNLLIEAKRYESLNDRIDSYINKEIAQLESFEKPLTDSEQEYSKIEFTAKVNSVLSIFDRYKGYKPYNLVNYLLLLKGSVLNNLIQVSQTKIFKDTTDDRVKSYLDLKKMYINNLDKKDLKGVEMWKIEALLEMLKTNIFRDIYANIGIKYKDTVLIMCKLERFLGDDELYVQMNLYNSLDTSLRYTFQDILNLKSNKKYWITAISGKKAEKVVFNSITSDFLIKDIFFKDIWSPLLSIIKNKKRIYISPDGIYNTINIGAIVQPNGRLLMEDYDIRIVTSARELIEQKEKKNYENTAVLVGNPTFNLAAPKQTALAANYTRSYTETPLFAWPTLTRGSIAPLPNTKAEVENIGKILQAKGFKTQTLLGDQALEEAVKAVKSPRILHIATHGFFEADVTKKDSLQADDFMGIQRAKAAENPLLRSGLLLAGAENYLKTKKLSNDHENGILTAYEAMNLDLENTELVVLSACETGLGEIKNGEGVYGLQRALRIAGAQSVLMSLAKVPDATTKILMEAFYENWLTKGMNKHEALKQAQLTVRKMPQYAAPVNWAAFVLVE